MIVKVQRAVWPPDHDALVYDKHRAFQAQVPMTPELAAMFGPKLKIYCKASHVEDQLTIHEIVPDRPW